MMIDDIPEDLMLSMSDIRAAGYCASGTRRWFEARGLDFRDMLKNGITARDLFATNDACAERVVTLKMERIQADG